MFYGCFIEIVCDEMGGKGGGGEVDGLVNFAYYRGCGQERT